MGRNLILQPSVGEIRRREKLGKVEAGLHHQIALKALFQRGYVNFSFKYCKSRNIDLQEILANLALGQGLNMIIQGKSSIITQI